MSLVSTPALVLSTLKYSESSKIVRLATRDLGVQSAIAKGARRPRSRFGAALQVLSEGHAQLYVRDHRELHTLAAFDLARVPVRLAEDLERYAAASVLAELMARFAPPELPLL
jgi:DNA repair protein RecO (recombination protein O)